MHFKPVSLKIATFSLMVIIPMIPLAVFCLPLCNRGQCVAFIMTKWRENMLICVCLGVHMLVWESVPEGYKKDMPNVE